MGSYKIEWKSSAIKELKSLPKSVVATIVAAVEKLGSSPRPHDVKKLVGTNTAYRIRVGDYRIVYNIYDARLVIEVIKVSNRKDVYR